MHEENKTIDQVFISTKNHEKFVALAMHLNDLGLVIEYGSIDDSDNTLVIWNKGLKGTVSIWQDDDLAKNPIKIKKIMKTKTKKELFNLIDSLPVL